MKKINKFLNNFNRFFNNRLDMWIVLGCIILSIFYITLSIFANGPINRYDTFILGFYVGYCANCLVCTIDGQAKRRHNGRHIPDEKLHEWIL
jgi:hypothetical protein